MPMIQTCLEVCTKSMENSILSKLWVMANMPLSTVVWGSLVRPMTDWPTCSPPVSDTHEDGSVVVIGKGQRVVVLSR